MKKSELTQLTQIIEVLVTREVRKQLPKLIGEVFSNMTGKAMITEAVRKEPAPQAPPRTETDDFKTSLKDLFAGATPTTRAELEESVQISPPRQMKNYTKDPILNQILNETKGDLRSKERMTGLAAYQGGYSGMPAVGAGPMMNEAEMPSFARNQPSMGTMAPPAPTAAPAPISENHVPLSDIPEGVSALDVARAGMTPAPVTEALTNYDCMRKILAASKTKRY